MHDKLLSQGRERTFALVLDTGDEAMDCVQRFAEEHHLQGSRIEGIGAFAHAELGYFDWETKEYLKVDVGGQVEVVALTGDVALAPGGGVKIHIHLVVAGRDGSTTGGHLMRGVVRPTLELMLTEAPRHLQRRHDPETGLALIDLDA